ncbi:MAG: excinuclease ABC subunit UvrC [Deltaproteobacteria bacterium]|nr:excinuclease ABC subunit UvrC [Deltaproteobacteria bacterium]
MVSEAFQSKLESLPQRPGCYIFKDAAGHVLYVGKATSLRSRVRSYFQESSSDNRSFLPLLRRNVDDLETIVTASEKEATILEASLVKQLKPRYNVKLRDDKSYLSLRVDTTHLWPRLELVRRPQPDGARYFGPHHSATAARRTLGFINKHFQLRTCTDQDLVGRKRPCLQYHIKRCPGPCVFDIDHDAYMANVQAVVLFLDGRHDEVLRDVDKRMRDASSRTDFEQAAVYRDQLLALRAVREGQRVSAVSDVDQDVIGLHRDGEMAEIAVAFVRSGRVVDTASFPMRKVEVPDEEVIGAFLSHYYGEDGPAAHAIPDEILVPVLPEGATGVADWLSERRNRKVKLIAPQRGARVHLLQLANDNAKHAFEEKRRASIDIEDRLADIQARLRLPSAPHVIECCDISHLAGGDTVGGLVRMVDGEPAKQGYRSYHVRGVSDGDDYAAIYEVLARRFRRGKEAAVEASIREASAGERADQRAINSEEILPLPELSPTGSGEGQTTDPAAGEGNPVREYSDVSGWQMPDLFVIDGGRGQLNAALAAAHDLGLHDLSIVALAKERETVAGETLTDRVYLPGQKNGIPVRPHTALVILARARDEAHRFANRGREKLGRSRSLRSALDDIPGIGEASRRRLLTHFGGLDAIRDASDEALLSVPGISKRQLAAIRKHLPVAPVEQEADKSDLATPTENE